jgi:hypothetical protein
MSQTLHEGLAFPTYVWLRRSKKEVGKLGGSGVAPAEDPELRACKRVEERGVLSVAKSRQLEGVE